MWSGFFKHIDFNASVAMRMTEANGESLLLTEIGISIV